MEQGFLWLLKWSMETSPFHPVRATSSPSKTGSNNLKVLAFESANFKVLALHQTYLRCHSLRRCFEAADLVTLYHIPLLNNRAKRHGFCRHRGSISMLFSLAFLFPSLCRLSYNLWVLLYVVNYLFFWTCVLPPLKATKHTELLSTKTIV